MPISLLKLRLVSLSTPLLLLFLILPQVTYAADYVWQGTGYGRYTGSSPYDAASNTVSGNSWISVVWCNRQNDVVFVCRVNTAPGGYLNMNVARSGDSCPNSDDIYKPESGSCEQDCSDTAGQQLAARGPDSPVTVDGDGYKTILPQPFGGSCFTGCYYELQSSFSDRLGCMLVSGSTDTGFCNYRVTGNGDACPASTGVPAGGGDPLNPSAPPPDPSDPPTDPGCPPPLVFNGNFCQTDPGDDPDPGDGGGDGGGPGDGGGDGGSGDGGDGDGDGGSGDGGSGDGGTGDGGGGSGDGDGDGDGSCEGDDCPSYPSLTEPEQGSFDSHIADIESQIAVKKQELADDLDRYKTTIQNYFKPNLGGGGGLPCFSNSDISLCLTPYTDALSFIKPALLFIAAFIAVLIMFSSRRD